ncbi:MAG: GNAT family N-acetyltransferase [Candidatus Wallbacteria bacterium]|nr:GNAT family N-acetyltransferase [Candidatus Wallbacteria bacterium]
MRINRELPLRFLPAGPEFLDRFLALQTEVAGPVPDHSVFHPDTPDELAAWLSVPGAAFAALYDDLLAGYTIASFPVEKSGHPGLDIGIPEAEFSSCLVIETSIVHPDFRGRGLQQRMIKDLIESWIQKGVSHVFSYCSPKNPASLKSLLRCGLGIRKTVLKFGGFERCLLHMDAKDGNR